MRLVAQWLLYHTLVLALVSALPTNAFAVDSGSTNQIIVKYRDTPSAIADNASKFRTTEEVALRAASFDPRQHRTCELEVAWRHRKAAGAD